MSIETPRVNAQRYLTCEQPTSFMLYQLSGLKLSVWVCVDQLTPKTGQRRRFHPSATVGSHTDSVSYGDNDHRALYSVILRVNTSIIRRQLLYDLFKLSKIAENKKFGNVRE